MEGDQRPVPPLALIPLVLARGEIGGELQHPLAVVILGGLVSSTLLNLAVIPVGLALFGAGPRAHVIAPTNEETRGRPTRSGAA